MAPRFDLQRRNDTVGDGNWRMLASDEDFILEGWSEGFMVGALVIMACITIANMRRKVLLHKLILVEQLAALSHGTFCFFGFEGYGWYLSSTAMFLYFSWIIHNVVAWMKIKPFFMDSRSMFKPDTGKWVRRIYLGTLALTVPFICWQIANNFRFFNNINNYYVRVRPYEPLMRDPWWVFTCLTLFHVINSVYGTGVFELIRRSPRFAILLIAICLALIFTAVDIAASIHNFIGSTDGINPWWKISLVFKCLTDTIMLDDFKTELKRLNVKRVRKEEMRRQTFALVDDLHDPKYGDDHHMEFTDALNASPLRFQTMQNLDHSPSHSPMGRPRQDSVADSQPNEKEAIGKAGKKISKLPAFKDFAFASGGRKKARIQDPEGDARTDASQPPTQPQASDRLADMRRSLGVIDYHTN
ncbi:hypothetical protein G647_04913 [Cladophialophora carrionii CBS 160.54]|uniref:Uncharacterized protein n=1 Tax=Cladophialophora carrionii CBS 160.54 TaxID=1279043 RepID=V9D8W6_9EURO|nr:uncharacterized protein G647_04913 [Cladophialophora carrionii CBS 160.54]ETI23116.1 hypothetical protein G647_04913 [Cladophialophora carrionii CBS 160.54]